MPTLSTSTRPDDRPADVLVQKSETRMRAMSLISSAQVKLWKAMFVSLFFAGFAAAVAFTVGLNINQKSEAASQIGLNLLKGSTITSSVFCETGECWDNLSSGGSLTFRQFGIPEAVVAFPGQSPYTLTSLVMDSDPALNDSTMLPKDIRVEASQDCQTYQPLLSFTKDQASSSQSFDFPSGTSARCLKLLFDSNWGHSRWTSVKGMRVMGY